jgi:hypothetical protein
VENESQAQSSKKRRKRYEWERHLVFAKTGGRCFYCWDELDFIWDFVCDHYIPLAKGGADDHSNLVPACYFCDNRKRSFLPTVVLCRRLKSGSTANSFQKRILTCLLPSQTRSSRGTSEARSGGTKDRGKPRQPGRAREGDSANMHEETIAALQKELQETRQASLDATRRGDFMKVARMTAHSAALNRQLMEAQDKQEAARTGANPRDARK